MPSEHQAIVALQVSVIPAGQRLLALRHDVLAAPWLVMHEMDAGPVPQPLQLLAEHRRRVMPRGMAERFLLVPVGDFDNEMIESRQAIEGPVSRNMVGVWTPERRNALRAKINRSYAAHIAACNAQAGREK